MRIIIAGDGKVGLALTRLLSQEGHDLVTIDSNRAVLERDMQPVSYTHLAHPLFHNHILLLGLRCFRNCQEH